MHLYLAFFWLIFGAIVNYFWDTLEQHRFVPVSRQLVTFACFVLFSYNFIRWRMTRVRIQTEEELTAPPPRPRVVEPEEYNPEFDFSKTDDAKKDDPPT